MYHKKQQYYATTVSRKKNCPSRVFNKIFLKKLENLPIENQSQLIFDGSHRASNNMRSGTFLWEIKFTVQNFL